MCWSTVPITCAFATPRSPERSLVRISSHMTQYDPSSSAMRSWKRGCKPPADPKVRHVAEGVDFDPWLEIRPVGGRRTGVVASRGLGFKVEPRAVEEAVVPHDAAGIVDDETVQRGGEDDI